MKVKAVKCYDYVELSFKGNLDGNPFTDYYIKGTFTGEHESKTVTGFYDGKGNYVVRFMPSFVGKYSFDIEGSFSKENYSGTFDVKKADKNNHGPVSVCGKYHFKYADGTPYYSVGTTCYVWELMDDKTIDKTLHSLKKSGFNKIRFCIFPKHYLYNTKEPRSYPFIGTPVDSVAINKDNFMEYNEHTEGNHWDFTRFNGEHFDHIEKCIHELKKLGIEADIIVFHPYDRWGFSVMGRENDERYVRYLIARLSAFSNVWWSMANEYDILKEKSLDDWKNIGTIFKTEDPYNHLRSIHNCFKLYDHTEDWITHVSFQRTDLYKTAEETDTLRSTYNKPVVLDEIAYEGNIQPGWGNISGQEMVRRFWEGFTRGGYPGHGETYLPKDGILWWSHGGDLKGESWKRVKFLLKIMNETPGIGVKPTNWDWDCPSCIPEDDDLADKTGYYIAYYSFNQPALKDFNFIDGNEYEVEIIDTWNMTIKKAGTFSGKFSVELPGKPYIAVRIRKKIVG